MTSAPAGRPRRTLALWCPDWPAVAAAADADISPDEPVAVISANRVVTCSATARAAGVRRGMRKRESQARCPSLHVMTADPGRDGRLFEPLVAAVAEVIPIVEVLRPGLMLLPAAGAARYFGGEEVAAEKLIDVVSVCGTESFTGIADELFTAVVAARHGQIVPAGGDVDFLAPLSIAELGAEPSLCGDDRDHLIDLLWRLGVRTMGAFAALSVTDVATRFGADAVVAHRATRAEAGRSASGRLPSTDVVIDHECDPPIDRVDAAAFVGRRLADELHRALMAASVACTRLTVHASTTGGQHSSRTWRCAEPLTPEATADRIRWQLDGWLSGKDSGNRPDSPISRLRLEPVELVDSGALQFGFRGAGIPGGDGEVADRARRALVRVQGLLGGEAVRVPVRSGGRGVAERITLIPLGDELTPASDPDAPWPGRIPEPAPAVVLSAPVTVRDCNDDPVQVTRRGMFSAEPTTVTWGSRSWDLLWWAGPWPADERWWAAPGEQVGTHARAQVLLNDSRALLLRYQQQGWTVEGVYE
ncbi:DNA polymerase [Williamsia sp. Leaf354]|uniref:DNA polymerase Y family protein n=1 Tax=Williamsia herbipolensis TaxID=1603258 RepID=A0AAU4K282_9NOCA|nr:MULTISPECIES: DNA polymerase Y family protein [Williamsia]KQR97332.1 DNA polymerase [Williamsia sp. Leaf354]MCX6470694.1 DNA polymerase Y family protein [Mycobacteriales bacterium]